MMVDDIQVISGTANLALTQEICAFLKVKVCEADIKRFSDGEISVQIKENIRGRDVFIVQPTCPPQNDNLMELLILIDAARRASAERITAVIPYYGYARQDRKDQPRVPITAKLVANLITVAGAHRVLTMDLHADQIQGFFDIPVDHLYAAPVFIKYFKSKKLEDFVLMSPDVGGIKAARALANRMGVPFGGVDKRRIDATHTEVMNVMGEVEGKNVIIVDDMTSTAGSLTQAAKAIKAKGAKKIYAGITHAVLCDPALERIKASAIEELAVSNSIPLKDSERGCSKIKVLSVADLLGEAILRIHRSESVSSLFV